MTQSVPSRMALATSVASARVGQAAGGHGFEHLSGGDHRLACVGLAMAHETRFWGHCDLFDGHFDAQIAAGDHDAVGGVEDLVEVIACGPPARSILAMMNGLLAQSFSAACAHGFDVGCGFDEGLTDGVYAVFHGELQAFVILVGKGVDTEVDSWEVEAFAGAEFAASGDCAVHVVARDAFDHELNETIVEIEFISWCYDAW